MAARLALMNLEKEFSSPQVTMTVDAKLIEERILDIITNHDGGVFMHRLPVYYSEQYGEVLSDEWQRIIERCPIIRKEKNAGNSTILVRAVVPLKVILKYNVHTTRLYIPLKSYSQISNLIICILFSQIFSLHPRKSILRLILRLMKKYY